ncbi:tRNA (adenosine(37)-N6)-threonylcarbamoyltransferase complex ATPase subunit type 1 TsaE [Candidatus Parcubacteria bacterium]|nr:tRNA (adenosine(37)-N6)-threonylcarbamoyltransferase complex ATPase subunit type 1 TsaE [Candidatus Parcubacteria bacterium]
MKFISKSLAETAELAENFVKTIMPKSNGACIVGLVGELGSGKTAFTQAVAKILGIEGSVTSPTFVIEKKYPLKDKNFDQFIHIDAYRLKDGHELLKLGWKDTTFNTKNLIFLEWPERVAGILSHDIKKVSFTFVDENTREIEW